MAQCPVDPEGIRSYGGKALAGGVGLGEEAQGGGLLGSVAVQAGLRLGVLPDDSVPLGGNFMRYYYDGFIMMVVSLIN